MGHDTICPQCHSGENQRLAVLYANGIATTKSFMIGFSMEPIVAAIKRFFLIGALAILPGSGLLFFGFALTQILSALFLGTIFSFTTTGLAKEIAPPKRFRTWLVALGALGLFSTGLWLQLAYSSPSPSENGAVISQRAALHQKLISSYGVKENVHSSSGNSSNYYPEIGFVLIILSPVVFVAFLVVGYYYNTHVWSPREAAWQRSFMCQRCGTIFIDPDFPLNSVTMVRSDKIGKGYLPRFETPDIVTRVRNRHREDFDLRKKRKSRSATGN